MGMMKEKNRKITVQETTMVYTGVSPIDITDDPQTNSTASVAPVQMAATGLRKVGETEARALEQGRPPSRENAKIMRETEVTVARPQSTCEMKIATYKPSLSSGLTWVFMAQKNTLQPCLAASSMLGNISTNALSITQPNSSDQTTDMTIPRGTDMAALRVSSEVWAEAS